MDSRQVDEWMPPVQARSADSGCCHVQQWIEEGIAPNSVPSREFQTQSFTMGSFEQLILVVGGKRS